VKAYPHRFRHTFAIMFLEAGGDPYTLQYLLGHEDMTVTRMYVKIASRNVSDLYRSPLDALGD
jgi:integrase/recombinase XerD